MDKYTEILMKERLPIHPKCVGEGFTDAEKKFLVATHCSRVEAIEMYDIIDEETGEIDPETGPIKDAANKLCRCSSYVNPSHWWKHHTWRCPLADHYRPDMITDKAKGRVGQQKQKKKKR